MRSPSLLVLFARTKPPGFVQNLSLYLAGIAPIHKLKGYYYWVARRSSLAKCTTHLITYHTLTLTG